MDSKLVNGIDVNTINDSNALVDLLDKVEDFELRKIIRARLKQVKDLEKVERSAMLNRLENQRELTIQKKLKDSQEQKQRYLMMYDQMAKSSLAGERKSLDISLYKEPSKNVSENKKKNLTDLPRVGLSNSSVNNKINVSARDKFKSMDLQNSNSSCARNFTVKPTSRGSLGVGMARSATDVKEMLLKWAQFKTKGYNHVDIKNFSSSWSDGMAFCALIHHYFPNTFDYNTLDPKNRRTNFELAFNVAEKEADIAPLLDVEDMVIMKNKPDWKCVFTYVQSMYRTLRNHD